MTVCRDKRPRRKAIREHQPEVNGIDYVEVDATQKILTIYFLGPTPQNITIANVRIDGGRRVRGIRVINIRLCHPNDPRVDGCLQVHVDRPGDFSTYTLRLVEADAHGRPGTRPLKGFDPRYAQIDFTFKAACPTTLDCAPAGDCPPEKLEEPEIDYLAKDYAGFRQLILDRLSLIMPDWKERHVPDVGIALVELLAYAGDTLSYFQDAVATEAYLDTARQRISVRRHATLVDYHVHDGCNARAWLTIETDTDGQLGDASFIVVLDRDLARTLPAVLSTGDIRTVPFSHYEVFEPMDRRPRRLFTAHNRISFYPWGDRECCLPRGATSATLVDEFIDDDGNGYDDQGEDCPPEYPPEYPPEEYPPPKYPSPDYAPPQPKPRRRRLQLQAGDVLIFEEVLGPVTGQAADADAAHRHVVRLTRVEAAVDALFDQPVLEIEWAEEDALPFPLCISAIGRAPECKFLSDISVARGNVLLVDHGRRVGSTGTEPKEEWIVPPLSEESLACHGEGEPREDIVTPPPFRPPALRVAPVTQAAPFPPPKVVARRQAVLLSGLLREVHARVEQLWRDACDGRALTATELEELRVIFGAKAAAAAGLTKKPPHCKPLQVLLQNFDRLLAKKAHRARVLAGRARAGYVMTATEEQEIVEMFGAQLAARLGLGGDSSLGPASTALVQDPTEALPAIRARERAEPRTEWLPRFDLLDSSGDESHFVAEIDDRGRAHARFGDGDRGRAPTPGSVLDPEYRTGNGARGNVGAEAISRIVFRNVDTGRRLRVRNPLPAAGGIDPQSVADAKLFAPIAFRTRIERAVTPDDYALLAQRAAPTRVQRAAAVPFRWNGSWYEARVAIDPLRTEELDDALREDIEASLFRFRRIGHDLRVVPADYVSLDVALSICVLPQFLRAHVEAALLDLFSNRVRRDGTLGFFHPDNLTFGDGIHLSKLVAAAQSVAGVESVKVTRLQRLFESPGGEIETGTLPIGPLEVARLDNDRSFPERGTLLLDVGGGR